MPKSNKKKKNGRSARQQYNSTNPAIQVTVDAVALAKALEPEAKAAAPAPVSVPLKWRRLPRFVIFFAITLYFEVIFRVLTVERFFNEGLFYIFLFAIPAAIVLEVLCGLFTPKGNRAVAISAVALLTLLYGTQIVYKNIFGTYMMFFSLLHGGEAVTYYREIIIKTLQNLPSLLLTILPTLFIILYGARVMSFKQVPLRRSAKKIASAVCCMAIGISALVIAGTDEFSPFDMFFRTSDINFSVDRLGLSTSMQVDVFRVITGFEPVFAADKPDAALKEPPKVEYHGTTVPATELATERPLDVQTEPTPVFVPQPNIIDIDFDSLIENETDADLLDMHKYFSSLTPTQTNEKTGIYEGCNVIFIVAEGFSHYVIDPERTPTLYKMATEGFEFTNFYNPVWSVSTSDGEYVAAQGLIPKSGVWSFFRSSNNWLPFQLGRQMPRLGYTAKAYHNHSATYYDRNLSHPNMGYDFKAVGMGLEMTKSWPESDLEMIDITTLEYVNDPPFLAYYMTVSGHLLYNFTGNNMAYRHRDVTVDLPYSEAVRAYLSCNYELELAMELLLERLEEAEQLDNTVIVISADHYPYGLTVEEISELAGHEIETDFELYKSALIIYKPGTPHEVINRPVSSLDIMPTLSNLLGLGFDSRLFMGIDAFSDTEPLVIFSNRSFITADARYSTKTKELTPNDGAELPEGYRKYWSNIINQKFAYSAQILDRDYYRVLFPDDAARAEALDSWRTPGG